jgi:hypothetical protein
MTTESEAAARLREAQEQATLPFKWTQTLVDVTLTLPCSVRSRQVGYTLTKTALRIVIAGETVVDGELYAPVKTDSSSWTLEGGEMLVVLEKQKGQEWWPCVIKGTLYYYILP